MENKHEQNEFEAFSEELKQEAHEELSNRLKHEKFASDRERIQFMERQFQLLYCQKQTELDGWREKASKLQANNE